MPLFEKLDDRQNKDGFFYLSFEEDGVYLIVYPPEGTGRKVTVNEVLKKLEQKKVMDFDKEAVELAVAKANQVPQKIAEPQEEVKIDASVNIGVSPDKMKATMIIFPPDGGRMLTRSELKEALKNSGVVYGIYDETLEMLAKSPIYNQQIVIAEGTPPVNGINGRLEFHFEINKDAKPTIGEDGRVNYKELNLIENVRKGQVLVTAIPPIPGKPGKNVLGFEIPALDGKPAVLPKGKNVEISPDGQSLLASVDGHVNYIDGKVSVFPLYEVQGDVDTSTGNINFVGSVLVQGNVLSGFSIEAGGNVEVLGVVEGATIKAGGNIILRRGMQGAGKGTLICEGDVVARYIEHSNIYAKGDIRAEVIMHSNIKCGNKLELMGRKGLLVGGVTKVGREVSAKIIGSPMTTITDIEVGVDPEVKERYKAIKCEIRSIEEGLRKTDQVIKLLKRLESVDKLTPEKELILSKSVKSRLFYINRLEELREELATLEEILSQSAQGKVRAQIIIYPGTRVTIGTAYLNVKENLHYCTLYRDGADVRVGPYDKL